MPRLLLVATFALLLCTAPAQAQQQSDPRDAVLAELFELMQMDTMLEQMSGQIRQTLEAQLRQKHPNISDEDISVVSDVVIEVLDEMMPPMMQMTAQVMLKYFTEEDLRAMLAFYRTPTGRKTIRVMPQMVAEVVSRQQQYIAQIAPQLTLRIQQRLREKGYEL